MKTFTLIHVVISLIGILSGFVVLFGMIANKRLDGWTKIFLGTTVATSATGFGFPVERILPSHIVGAISLVVLALSIYARYGRQLAGAWRKTYVITALMALYFNVFVAVVQAFLKVPSLKAIAPTQSEPAFKITQLTVLLAFVVVTVIAAIKFKGAPSAGKDVTSIQAPVPSS